MKNIHEYATNLYLTDEYILKNPSLDVIDSPWKVSKITPLVDSFISYINKDEINLLDVGGGAGLILNAISSYIEESYGIEVNKFALDLSPGMLNLQQKSNPGLKKALNENIRKTSLVNKEIDLTLMVDVLEHVPNPTEALEEIKRISKFVIFKVPLENNLILKTWDFIKTGKERQRAIETIGHINVYNFSTLKYQIEKHTGQMLDSYFTNVSEYYLNSEYYKNEMKLRKKSIKFIAAQTFKLSPRLCSSIFCDYVMLLVKCY